jgi:hypothetical protein
LPANLLFVIDRSGSMNCNLPPITSSADCESLSAKKDQSLPSKWEIVRDALKATIAKLTATTGAGITYFSNDNQCGVQSKPNVGINALDTAQIEALNGSLDAVQPLGQTPIVGAVTLAYKWFNPNQNPVQPYGNKFVVLLTDGQESCATTAQLEDFVSTQISKATHAYIKTFVIGVPGSEVDRSFLSAIAFAGGTPSRPDCDHTNADPTVGDCHFDMTTQSDLATALTQALNVISGQALVCEFDVPQPGSGQTLNYNQVNVVYRDHDGDPPQTVYRDDGHPCDGGANGWQYNADQTKILICGAACDAARNAASIDIALGCGSIVVPK